MNKLIFTLALFLFGLTSLSAQEHSTILTLNADNSYSYEKVFEKPGKTKEQIFEAMKTWILKNVKTNQVQSYFDDVNKNIITTNPTFACSLSSVVDFKLNIEIKDGRYKLSTNSFIWHSFEGVSKVLGDYSQYTYRKKEQAQVLADVDKSVGTIITSLETSLDTGSNW